MTYDEMLKAINGIDDDSLDLFNYVMEKDMENGVITIKKIVNCDDVTAKSLWADMCAMDNKYDKEHPDEDSSYVKPAPSNIPTCPTCCSTNIQKISGLSRAAHGYMFGLFSKTAKSQFCCKNCGYKW